MINSNRDISSPTQSRESSPGLEFQGRRSSTPGEKAVKAEKKRKWKKPKGMPKRPLSAYNLFFANERQRILQSHGACYASAKNGEWTPAPKAVGGFAGLARSVASKWKELDDTTRAQYQAEANKEQIRYKRELREWRRLQEMRQEERTSAQTMDFVSSPHRSRSSSDFTAGVTTGKIDSTSSTNNQNLRSLWGQNLPLEQPTLWPATSQTRSMLGNMYDDWATAPASTRFRMEAPDETIRMEALAQRNNLTLQYDLVHQCANEGPSTFWVGPSLSGPQNRGLPYIKSHSTESEVSSPERIRNLALQLDDEAREFLKSLAPTPTPKK